MLEDEQETREEKGGEDGKESGIPEPVRIDADEPRGALRNGEGEQQPGGGKDAKGGESEMAELEEVGVHGRLGCVQRGVRVAASTIVHRLSRKKKRSLRNDVW